MVSSSTSVVTLPPSVAALFWDHKPGRLEWDRDRDFIVGRALAAGGWEAARFVRVQLGDTVLRDWFVSHRGRGLSAPRLRFWQLVLDLDPAEVSRWIDERRDDPWTSRGAHR